MGTDSHPAGLLRIFGYMNSTTINPDSATQNPRHLAAIELVELGYPVFPVPPKSKIPYEGSGGCHDATCDADQIDAWWTKNPGANLAVSTDHFLVLDVDGADHPWLADAELLYELSGAPMVRTPRGGRHFWFAVPEGYVARCTQGHLAPNVDTRGVGGYALCPPSTTSDGEYTWLGEPVGTMPERLPLAPDWMLNKLAKPKGQPSANGKATGEDIPEGKRNGTLATMAGAMRRRGMDSDAIHAALSVTNQQRCRPPLPEEEVKRIAESVSRYDPVDDSYERMRQRARQRQAAERQVTYQCITSAELDSGNYDINYLIDGHLVAGQPMIVAGLMKTLKTTIALDASIALALGGHFLGRLPVSRRCRVMVMSGESGLGTLQETARRICRAAGHDLASIDNLLWSPDLPRFGDARHLAALDTFLADHGAEVLVLDPAYLALPGADAGNLMITGELLRDVTYLCQSRGVTLILLHHLKRSGHDHYDVPELSSIAWAGFCEYARQWWLLARRERYVPGTGAHKLWMSAGGSAGHSALWAVDIDEGLHTDPGGRRWEVELLSAEDARQDVDQRRQEAKQREQQEQIEADRKTACRALARHPEGLTQTRLRDESGISGRRWPAVLSALIEAGDVVECEVTVGNQRTTKTGYKLAT